MLLGDVQQIEARRIRESRHEQLTYGKFFFVTSSCRFVYAPPLPSSPARLLSLAMTPDLAYVTQLLAAGADPSIRAAASNMSPLDIVAHCASTSDITAVRLHFKPAFTRDATLGPRLVRALVEGGAAVDEVDPKGFTALQTACAVGSSGNVVQALLDAGADARALCAGHEFLPALHLAAVGGNPGALRVLAGPPGCGGLNELGPAPDRLVRRRDIAT